MAYSPNYMSGLQREEALHPLPNRKKALYACFGSSRGAGLFPHERSPHFRRHSRECCLQRGSKPAYIDGYFRGNVTEERILELKEKAGPKRAYQHRLQPPADASGFQGMVHPVRHHAPSLYIGAVRPVTGSILSS